MIKHLDLVKNSDLSLPRVTHILSATDSQEDKERLRKWAHKMDKVHGTGGGEQQRDIAAKRGTNFHTAIYNYIQSGGEHLPGFEGKERERWEMALRVVDMFKPFVFAMESRIQSNVYGYRGTPDAFAFEGSPAILDWKTSDRFKKREWIKNYELQVTAYALAAQEYGLNVETCHICIFSPKKAQQFIVNVNDRRDEWLRRLEQYQQMQTVGEPVATVATVREEPKPLGKVIMKQLDLFPLVA
jgi:genome maintenance exonuclease 1